MVVVVEAAAETVKTTEMAIKKVAKEAKDVSSTDKNNTGNLSWRVAMQTIAKQLI